MAIDRTRMRIDDGGGTTSSTTPTPAAAKPTVRTAAELEAERKAALDEVTRLRREFDTTTSKGAKEFAASPEAQDALARLDAAKSAVGLRTSAEDLALLNKLEAEGKTPAQIDERLNARPGAYFEVTPDGDTGSATGATGGTGPTGGTDGTGAIGGVGGFKLPGETDADTADKTVYTAPDGKTFTDQQAYVDYLRFLSEQSKDKSDAALDAANKAAKNKNAREFLIASLQPYFASAQDTGFLDQLTKVIDDYISQDYDIDTISVLLPQTEAYKTRFKGNEERAKAGLSMLSPAEYIQSEEQYNEILKRFNLGDLSTRDTFATLIGGQVSAAELTDRVVNVYDRIRNADPALRAEMDRVEALSRGQLSDADFAKALLTGGTGAEELKRKITTAEISAEARQRNLSVGRAQELQQLGVTREEARAGFETIAQAQPVFEKLTGIYDRTALAPEESQTELEREVFQGMASERRRRVAQQEQASFSGRSGLAGSALSTQRAGQL